MSLHDSRRRFNLLVPAGEVDPEQDPPDLAALQTLSELVRADAFRVPYASSGPKMQEPALGQARSFDLPGGAGRVGRAACALEGVPQVVEPAVRMLGVQVEIG